MNARLTIDLGAIRENLERMAALVAPARVAAVVKANAYGHGLLEVARVAESVVPLLCVYEAAEAAALREGGIRCEVTILGPTAPADLRQAHAARAQIALWDTGGYLRDVERAGTALGGPFEVHAKVDTGLTRLGLEASAAASAIGAYLENPALRVRGAYTHLAAVEELESGFTSGQLATFERALAPVARELERRGAARHAAASAAAMLYPASRLDIVRVGIAAYGIWPSEATRAAAGPDIVLEPALAWSTELVAVREVEAGRSVGYGCTFCTSRPSRIGILPVGYAEGVPRAVSNRGYVLVGGRRAPIVGRICMNMSFIDLTDIPAAQPGASVTLIGRDGEETIEANEWGTWASTIGYEIVARLPREIPRRYVRGELAGALPNSATAAARSSEPS